MIALIYDKILGKLRQKDSSGINYISAWDAAANSPSLSDGSIPVSGTYYIVSTPGSTSLGGFTSWAAGDWLISDGTRWGKIDNQNVPLPATVTQAEAEAGTVTATRMFTPQRISQAIAALGGGGGSIVNTTTTGSVTIPAPGTTVVVNTTDQYAAGAKGQNVLVTDGTHLMHGIVTVVGTKALTVQAGNFTGDTAASGVISSGAAVSVDFGMVNVLWHYEFSDSPFSIDTPTLNGTVPGDLEIVFGLQNYIDEYLYWRVNGDSTNGHYGMQELYVNGSGTGAQHQGDTQFSYIPLSGTYPSMMRARMINYTSSDPKPVEYNGGHRDGMRLHFGYYTGGAITSISFYPGSYHFVSGSITIRRIRHS